jgi:hypothetical protein
MGQILKIKLFESDKLSVLAAAIAAFQAANTATKDSIRGMAMSMFKANDGDINIVKAMAWQGSILPASKVADIQHVTIVGQKIADVQTALDAALAAALHKTVADGDTTTPNHLVSATMAFVATDVGRKISITESGVVQDRVITVRNSATDVTYAGTTFVSGTGKTVRLLGAESMQVGSLSLDVFLADDGDTQIVVDVALEGQLPA